MQSALAPLDYAIMSAYMIALIGLGIAAVGGLFFRSRYRVYIDRLENA